jgi:hypothetical protein
MAVRASCRSNEMHSSLSFHSIVMRVVMTINRASPLGHAFTVVLVRTLRCSGTWAGAGSEVCGVSMPQLSAGRPGTSRKKLEFAFHDLQDPEITRNRSFT